MGAPTRRDALEDSALVAVVASSNRTGHYALVGLRWVLKEARQPWGDYGDVLAFGMTRHLGRSESGQLRFEHAGPFVPPFFLTGAADLLLKDSVKTELDDARLSGYTLRSVELARIVNLDWRSWNLDAEDPLEYPASGEPEDYLLTRPHDPSMAEFVGPIWELGASPWREVPDADFGRGLPERRSMVVSDAAAEWIDSNFSEWVELARWTPNP